MKFKQSFFELLLLGLILYSIVTHFIELEFHETEDCCFFLWSERIITLIFTIEYIIRWAISRKLTYPCTPMAIIDLLAIMPFYLGFMVDMRSLRLLRAVRVLRLFKLYRYTDALKSIQNAFAQVQYEFGIIGFAVLTLAWICSVAVYELEKDAQPQVFARLTDAAWYTMTTLTTVGYGDKVPVTLGGRLVAVFMMLCGLGLFGTFVSLIGSAFLEELRKHPRRTVKKPHAHEPHWNDIDDSEKHFDPARVLRAINAGTFSSDDEQTRKKTIHLLATACQILAHERQQLAAAVLVVRAKGASQTVSSNS